MKTCPFCGGKEFRRWQESDPWHRFFCLRCKAISPPFAELPIGFNSEQIKIMAIQAWNNRAPN